MASLFKAALLPITIFLTLLIFLHTLNFTLNLLGDSLARLYFVFAATVSYTYLLSYALSLKADALHVFRRALRKVILCTFPPAASYIIFYFFLQNRSAAFTLHAVLLSLQAILKHSHVRSSFSRNIFLDGFIVQGFIVKRFSLLLQVYPSTSPENLIPRLVKCGDLFLLKRPLGYIMLLKLSALCPSYWLWRSLLQPRLLRPVSAAIPTFCHARVLSKGEVEEFLGVRYLPVEASHLSERPPVDLIRFTRRGGEILCGLFKAEAGGLTLMSLKGGGCAGSVGSAAFKGLPLVYDEKYSVLKSLYTLKRLIEVHGGGCTLGAKVVEEGEGFKVKILSSPETFFERRQLNLQLSLYSLNVGMLQKG